MYSKYKKHFSELTLKNHLIYLINLYLKKQSNTSELFTPEEEADMDITVNAIPYFDYVSKIDIVDTNIMEYKAHIYIEKYCFRIIKK
jgi:hypothetical protein